MSDAGRKIIDGLKDAIAGNFARVTIEGQVWVRQDARHAAQHAALMEAARASAEAIGQALDDMGMDGHCVCEQAKQMLRAALSALKAAGIETEG